MAAAMMASGALQRSNNSRMCDETALSLLSELCLDDSVDPKRLLMLVKALYDSKILQFEDSKILEDVITVIGKLLNSKESPWALASLTACCIDRCNALVLSKYSAAWLRSFCHLLSSSTSPVLRALLCQNMSKLISLSTENSGLSREISNDVIPLVIRCLIHAGNDLEHRHLLGVILQCMRHYPGPSGKFIVEIRGFCMSIIRSCSGEARQMCCRCLALIPWCESDGGNKLKFAERWQRHCAMILRGLDGLLDILFLVKNTEQPTSAVSFFSHIDAALPTRQPDRGIETAERLDILFSVLSCLLEMGTTAHILLPLQSLLDVLSRVVTLSGNAMTASNTIELAMHKGILPSVFLNLLKLAVSLIKQCGCNLAMYSTVMFNMLLDMHDYIQDSRHSTYSSFPAVVIAWLEVSEAWLSHVGSIPVQHIQRVADIFLKESMPMGESRPVGRQSKKRSLSKAMEEDFNAQQRCRPTDCHANAGIATTSLRTLNAFINQSGPMIPSTMQTKIINAVISIAVQALGCSPKCTDDVPIPYGDHKCRLGLCIVISSLLTLFHASSPSPVPLLLSLLSRGCHDVNIIVSSFCTTSRRSLDCVLKPAIPSLRDYNVQDIEPPSAAVPSFHNYNIQDIEPSAAIPSLCSYNVQDIESSAAIQNEPTHHIIPTERSPLNAESNSAHHGVPVVLTRLIDSCATASDKILSNDDVASCLTSDRNKKLINTDADTSKKRPADSDENDITNDDAELSKRLKTSAENSISVSSSLSVSTCIEPSRDEDINASAVDLDSITDATDRNRDVNLCDVSSASNVDLELKEMLMSFVDAPPDSD